MSMVASSSSGTPAANTNPFADPDPAPLPATTIAMINIRAHVPYGGDASSPTGSSGGPPFPTLPAYGSGVGQACVGGSGPAWGGGGGRRWGGEEEGGRRGGGGGRRHVGEEEEGAASRRRRRQGGGQEAHDGGHDDGSRSLIRSGLQCMGSKCGPSVRGRKRTDVGRRRGPAPRRGGGGGGDSAVESMRRAMEGTMMGAGP